MRGRMAAWWFAACAVTLLCRAACGAVYVVDRNAPGASDDNPGTEEKPFATVQKAAEVAKAGDTVYVMEGEYDEVVVVKASGTKDSPITFVGAPRWKATVRGFDLRAASCVTVAGFRITSPRPGQKVTAIVLGSSSDIRVTGNLIEGPPDGLQPVLQDTVCVCVRCDERAVACGEQSD